MKCLSFSTTEVEVDASWRASDSGLLSVCSSKMTYPGVCLLVTLAEATQVSWHLMMLFCTAIPCHQSRLVDGIESFCLSSTKFCILETVDVSVLIF